MTATPQQTENHGYPTIHKVKEAAQWNMPDYDRFYQNLHWKDMARELNLPRENGINQASVCIDGHPPEVMQRTALIWRSATGAHERYTFNDLKRKTNQFANVLKDLGVQKGERVFVFLERIPELYIAVFGALKVGAVVGPLFSAFGPEAIRDRLQDSGAVLVVTSLELKPRLDSIRAKLPELKHVILVDKKGTGAPPLQSHEVSYESAMAKASENFTVPYTNPDDYAIIHYTSGTTGKPKGAVHRHAAVIAQAATTKYVLDLKPESDIYWCTADPGWVTGTSYGMFGPWSLGATILVYEGGFKAEDWYQILQEEKITVWYTAPTAIRMLMKAGDELPKRYDFSGLRHLCSVGEPLNPEAVIWGVQAFGHVFHDTWWQTETGAMHICNYPCMDVKPGSMGKPFPGVHAAILDDEWNPLPPGNEGHLAIRPEAPSLFRTYWHKDDMYQSKFKNGWYVTGDRAYQDVDGYFWFVGRADDVINTAGHLVGPFEVESALIEHPAVAEAGVIGKPDPERMEIVKAFISLKAGYQPSESLQKEIQDFVRKRLAAHAYPREIEFLQGLPKTRSGKIMRRLLKTRELGLPDGDTSTLEE
jgi:acetyl-CoA synthetase